MKRNVKSHVKADGAVYLFVYLSQDVSVAVTGGEMQRGVIATVHDVNTGAAHDEHVHNAAPTFPACPVEGAESVVITEITVEQKITAVEQLHRSCSWRRRICRVSVADADEERPHASANTTPLFHVFIELQHCAGPSTVAVFI